MEEVILGHFAILEKIGEGGMGVVYKARDTRLERTVAIKALPESKAADSDRRRRFIQEAKAASALNHPNIVTIHEILEQDGHSYIVMEFIDGKPLSDLIPRRGLKLAEALRLATQAADALAAAHAAGIVHRDIKPGNVMVDSQGRVKVLDFGLAKSTGGDAISNSGETVTVSMSKPLTQEGAIVGSVPYMSPEQAEGKPVDARSDIFSFGAVLYEMVTGQQAFPGDSRAATLAMVIARDPKPAGELVPGIPPELERLIARCLRKDVNRRSQHMSDVRLALVEVREESESGSSTIPAAVGHGSRRTWMLAAAVCLTAAALSSVWIYRSRPSREFRAPELVRLSPDDGYSYTGPTISPDGKLVAYISDRSGKTELWLQQAGGNEPVQLTHSKGEVGQPSFFPDGTRILYVTKPATSEDQGSLEIIPALGGQPRVLSTGWFNDVSLSPDGRQVAYFAPSAGQLSLPAVLPTAGGQPRSLPNWRHTQGRVLAYTTAIWTPDSKFLLCLGSKQPEAIDLKEWEWFALPADGGEPVPTGAGQFLRDAGFSLTEPSVVSTDRLLVSGPGQHVFAVNLLPHPWRLAGTPRQLTFGTETEWAASIGRGGAVAIQTSRSNSELFLIETDVSTGQASGIVRRLPLEGRFQRLTDAGGDPGVVYFEDVSPGTSGDLSDALGLDLGGGSNTVLGERLSATYSKWRVLRDGRQIAFSEPKEHRYEVSVGAAGAPIGSAKILCTGCGWVGASSPDGRFLIVSTGPAVTQPGGSAIKRSVHLVEISTGTESPWLDDPVDSLTVQDNAGEGGNAVVISAHTPGSPANSTRTYLVPWRALPVPRSEWMEVPAAHPHFSPTSNLLYFFRGDRLVAMKFDLTRKWMGEQSEVRFPAGPEPSLKANDSWVVRGPGIVFSHVETKRSVWLMKLAE